VAYINIFKDEWGEKPFGLNTHVVYMLLLALGKIQTTIQLTYKMYFFFFNSKRNCLFRNMKLKMCGVVKKSNNLKNHNDIIII
jgi:hypothetical protein